MYILLFCRPEKLEYKEILTPSWREVALVNGIREEETSAQDKEEEEEEEVGSSHVHFWLGGFS